MVLTLELKLQTLTPAFLTGADPTQGEIRWSSIVGPLRYWFRAMMGKWVGNDRERLASLETVVFGDNSRAAGFRAYVSSKNLVFVPAGETTSLPSGELYLAFSQYDHIGREHMVAGKDKMLKRSYLEIDQIFTANLAFHRPDALFRDVLLGAFWLLVCFGGIGTRTRRGFGGLCITPDSPMQLFRTESKLTAVRHVQETLKLIDGCFRDFAKRYYPDVTDTALPVVPGFTSFASWDAIMVTDARYATKDGYDWLAYWGAYLRTLRNGTRTTSGVPASEKIELLERTMRTTTPDYQNVVRPYFGSDAPNPTITHNLDNLAFGLPYTISSRNSFRPRKPSASVIVTTPRRQPIQRRASPLHLRPVPLKDGSLGCLFVFFYGDFLPARTTFALKEERKTAIPITSPDLLPGNPTSTRLFRQLNSDFGVNTATLKVI